MPAKALDPRDNRQKRHLSMDPAWLKRLDQHRGRESSSRYIERVLTDHWDRLEFRPAPKPAESHKSFFGVPR